MNAVIMIFAIVSTEIRRYLQLYKCTYIELYHEMKYKHIMLLRLICFCFLI